MLEIKSWHLTHLSWTQPVFQVDFGYTDPSLNYMVDSVNRRSPVCVVMCRTWVESET